MATAAKEAPTAALSPAAKRAIDIRKCEWRGQFRRCKPLLEELAQFDAQTDARRASVGKRLGLFVFLAVLCTVGIVVAVAVLPNTNMATGLRVALTIVFVVGDLVFIGLAIPFSVRYFRLKKLDLANDFRESLVPFLDMIAEDVHPKAKMKVDLDLESGTVKRKQVRKGKVPTYGRYRKIVETVYNDPWCNVTLPLVDGSTATFTIENTFVAIDRHWTTHRRGKTKFKHKRKWKKRVVMSATLVPNAKYLRWNKDQVRAAMGSLAPGKKLKAGTGKGKQGCRLVKKFKFGGGANPPPGTAPPKDMFTTLMELFSMLGRPDQREGESHA